MQTVAGKKEIKMALCKDVNIKLLPMKIIMFGYFGASSCAIPYMTVHMKELGLTVEETAIVYTMLPITQFLSSPIAGFIGDRIGKYRDVLLISILMTIVLATAILYVPPIDMTRSEVNISFVCGNSNIADMPCDESSENKINASSIIFKSCHLSCNDSSSNYTPWNLTSEQTNALNISICNLNSRTILLNNESHTSICGLIPSNISSDCSIVCYVNRPTISETSAEARSSRQLTFYLYCMLRIVYNIFSAIGFTLVNSSAIALTETTEDMGEYGRQRLWAILSMAIFSPLAGILVDVMSANGEIDYAPAFHVHNILSLLTCVAVWYLDFEMEDAPASYKETFKAFWLIVRRPSIFFLLIVVFWLGTMYGFLESFLFWFMQELDSPTYMLGLTVTVGSLVGLPFLYYARLIVAKVGHTNLLSIAVFMYMVRCVGCSFLIDPWWIMPFECSEIFTYHLMWVAAATYAAQLSPPGLLATIQGFIEGVHFGVGQGSGSLIGGSLMSAYGTRPAFQVMGGISGIIAIIYALLHFLWLRKTDEKPRSRRASVKSFGTQKPGRKGSSLSNADVNGSTMLTIIQRTTNTQETTPSRV